MGELEPKLSIRLQEILDDSRAPVLAGEDFASRDSSLATGTSGVQLALAEYFGEANRLPIDTSLTTNIFDAEIGCGWKVPHKPREETGALDLGDIFDGHIGLLWTDLVLGRTLRPTVTRRLEQDSDPLPGLAHGLLARSLFSSLVKGQQKLDESRLGALTGRSGWCNGFAGKAVALATIDNTNRSASHLNECLLLARSAVSQADQLSRNANLSLCHGLAGVAVVCAGLFRQYREPEFEELSQLTLNALHSGWARRWTRPEMLVDNSWLTGAAGLLWATSAVRRLPWINPIFPTDSSVSQSLEALSAATVERTTS